MCYTYDKSKGGDTRELQSRMVPTPKKLGRVTLKQQIKTRFPGIGPKQLKKNYNNQQKDQI